MNTLAADMEYGNGWIARQLPVRSSRRQTRLPSYGLIVTKSCGSYDRAPGLRRCFIACCSAPREEQWRFEMILAWFGHRVDLVSMQRAQPGVRRERSTGANQDACVWEVPLTRNSDSLTSARLTLLGRYGYTDDVPHHTERSANRCPPIDFPPYTC